MSVLIRDKQELRRCIKQTVRRSPITETLSSCAICNPANLEPLFEKKSNPFHTESQACYAALDALELPTEDEEKAKGIVSEYEKEAWLREVLDAMHAKRILAQLPMGMSIQLPSDDRIVPCLRVDGSVAFVRGRYGVNYAEAANEIASSLEGIGARDLFAINCTICMYEDCLLPLSEDVGCLLHVHFQNMSEAEQFASLLEEYPNARVIVSVNEEIEAQMIVLCAAYSQMLLRLASLHHLHEALCTLGTRFILSLAGQTENLVLSLGATNCTKEKLWQSLVEAYLEVARSGYPLTTEQIEQDVHHILGNAIETMYLR